MWNTKNQAHIEKNPKNIFDFFLISFLESVLNFKSNKMVLLKIRIFCPEKKLSNVAPFQDALYISPRMCAHSVGLKKSSESVTNFISCHIPIDLDSNQPSELCGCITRCTLYLLQDVGTLCRIKKCF